MCRRFCVSVMSPLYNTISWVSLSYWLNNFCFLLDKNNEHTEPSQCQWLIALSPRRIERKFRSFPLSVMNALYRTISWVCLLYWPDKFCLLGDLNECWKASSVALTVGLFKNISWENHHIYISNLSPRGPEQWMCRSFPCFINDWPFQDNHLSKAISSKALSLGNNEHKESSPVLLKNSLLWTIFWVKLSLTHWSYACQQTWRMNVKGLLCILLHVPLLTWHKNGYHITNMSHTAIRLNGHIGPKSLPISTKIQPIAIATSHIICKYVQETNMPIKCHICHICQLLYVHILDNYARIYISYDLNVINTVIKSTAVYTFHITDICPWTNMSTIMHINALLHVYCNLHIDPIIAHTSIKK